MKKLNNKGAFQLVLLVPYVIGAGFAVVGYGATQANYGLDSFRQRKAIEYCVAERKSNCVDVVGKMSKDDVLAYIKDTQESPKF